MFSKLNVNFLSLALALLWSWPGCIDGYSNSPQFDLSCDKYGISVRLEFSETFRGSIFAAGYAMNSLCSFPFCPDDKVINVFIPRASCGTKLRETETTVALHNTIVIQEHGRIGPSDTIRPISCAFPRTENSLVFQTVSQPILPLSNSKGGNLSRSILSYPTVPEYKNDGVEAWMELKLGIDILGEQALETALGTRLLLAVYVNDGGKHKDLNIRNCYAHDHETVQESRSVIKVVDVCGHSDFISNFTVTKSRKSDLMSYSTFEAFLFPAKGQMYLTCSLQLCKDSCPKTCNNSENDHVNAVIRKKLMKRSIPEPSPAREYEERHRLMKATIKALASKLMMYTRRPRLVGSVGAIEKRILKPSIESEVSDTTVNDVLAEISTVNSNSVELNEDLTTLSDLEFQKDLLLTTLESSKEISEDAVSNVDTTVDSAKNFFTVSEDLSKVEPTSVGSSITELYFNSTKDVVVSPSDESTNPTISAVKERTDCVPRLRFAIVTGLLSFAVFCLLLTSIALVLHSRKEKKKHLIDNFLLYNFN